MSFVFSYDIANRALQHLGQTKISSFTDMSMQANETNFIYDKVRQAELRRAVWTFSTRRMVLRKTTSSHERVVFPVYSGTQAYTAGDIVQDSTGYLWLATASGTGVAPGTEGYYPMWVSYFGQMYAAPWSSLVQYYPGDMTLLSGAPYLATAPTLNLTPPSVGSWHALAGSPTLSLIVNYSPTGYQLTPTTQRGTFFLPANFQRLAAQDPKIAGAAHNTVTAGMKYSDWELEDGVIYSPTLADGAVIRFVADVRDVTRFDAMYCEAIAARMAMGLNERFTSSPDKYANIKQAYDSYMAEARAMASIEAGSTEDDYQAPEPAPQQQRGR